VPARITVHTSGAPPRGDHGPALQAELLAVIEARSPAISEALHNSRGPRTPYTLTPVRAVGPARAGRSEFGVGMFVDDLIELVADCLDRARIISPRGADLTVDEIEVVGIPWEGLAAFSPEASDELAGIPSSPLQPAVPGPSPEELSTTWSLTTTAPLTLRPPDGVRAPMGAELLHPELLLGRLQRRAREFCAVEVFEALQLDPTEVAWAVHDVRERTVPNRRRNGPPEPAATGTWSYRVEPDDADRLAAWVTLAALTGLGDRTPLGYGAVTARPVAFWS
jgi:hypothetical protein